MNVADATTGAGKPTVDTVRNGCNSAVTLDPAATPLGGVQFAASVTTKRRPTVSTTVRPLDSSPTLATDPIPGISGGNDDGIGDPPPWECVGALPETAPSVPTVGVAAEAHPASSATQATPEGQPRANRSIVENIITTAV
jgi:hypothetical protein